ncbi:Fluoride ion transporter CrcB [hydrothermal vent metagenome]|uniref:Fluoride ion transporter CrcB n=1 Tax=hydrothermal vent metagenome TaxID=652676 RepID=A0A3B0W191_9ZZZZ
MKTIIFLAIGGTAGTLLRYWLSVLVQSTSKGTLPIGTFTVNMLGCFLFGAVWSLAEGRIVLSPHMRLLILVGFMGAFTTFSTFAFESGSLLRETQFTAAIINILAQNVVGIIVLLAGIALGRAI